MSLPHCAVICVLIVLLTDAVIANGPIQVAFTVYADFMNYKSGVYVTDKVNALGGHAVKLIGWGVTSTGQAYWVINNRESFTQFLFDMI